MPVQSYAPYGANAVRTVGKQRPRSGAGVWQGGNARIPSKSRPQPGKTVGHYMLGKTIGEGTFGKVKMGTHILTGEKVAVKVLEKSRICEKADVTRVAREIKILKRNLHHNVIQLFEVLDTPATIYLIMENADRGELFDYIVAHQRVEEPQACFFFHQIIDGVDYLHQMEVTHRDLKPENLLLQNSSRGLIIKIVDFGLSNTHDRGRKLKTACGSPCYAAPEMIAGNGEKYYEGPKADLWSVGVILFALVCGYLPFEDANTTKLYKKILAGDYTAPKWISPEVRDLISKILNTNPITRYTIANIRKHNWYNAIDMKQAPAVDKPGEGEIDEVVIVECEKLGLNRQALTESIIAGHHNNATTTYYLLKKKLFRENSRYVFFLGGARLSTTLHVLHILGVCATNHGSWRMSTVLLERPRHRQSLPRATATEGKLPAFLQRGHSNLQSNISQSNKMLSQARKGNHYSRLHRCRKVAL
jgi:5'-AMP-activated protein kinase catalytic alpha subunit